MSDVDDEFTALYRAQADRVYAYLFVQVSSPAVAEDMTGQVFLEAWRQRDTVVIDPGLGWGPWLFGVARNLARAARRDQSRVIRVDPSDTQNLDLWCWEDDPAWTYQDREEHRTLIGAALTAVGQLTASDRDVIELCVIGGLTPSQAAVVLAQSGSTVRSRLTRARRRLRDLTQELLDVSKVGTP